MRHGIPLLTILFEQQKNPSPFPCVLAAPIDDASDVTAVMGATHVCCAPHAHEHDANKQQKHAKKVNRSD
jgi:hypothetical protein